MLGLWQFVNLPIPKVWLQMAGRPNQAGSIRLRPGTEDQWRLRISLGRDPITNRYKVIEQSFRGSEAQAKRRLARMVTDHEDGKITAERCSLDALLRRYITHCEARERAPTTLESYKRMADWLKPEYGSIQIRKLSGMDIDALLARITKEKGNSSAEHYYRMLRAAFTQAVKWKLLATAPTMHATSPPIPAPRMTAPDPETVRALIAKAEDDEDDDLASIILVAATTGMRRGELCALRVTDVDIEKGELIVRRAVSRVVGATHIRSTKTNKVRRIALDPATVVAFERQIRRVRHRRNLAGSSLTDSYIWARGDHDEMPKPPDSVTQSFVRVRNSLGLELHFHDLRHFAATQMLAAGVDVVTAAGRLGHSPAMMLKTYAHAIQARDQEAAAILGNLLSQPSEIPAIEPDR